MKRSFMRFLVLFTAVMLFASCTSNGSTTPNPAGATENGKNDGPEDIALTRERIDRFGRPEITNFTVRDQQSKVVYNADDAFALNPENVGLYRRLLAAGVLFWDALDAAFEWSDPERLAAELPPEQKLSANGEEFVDLLANDFMLVDVSKPCTVDTASYLEIEERAIRGEEHETCGGRTPNDDVIDRYVTVLIAGPTSATAYGDAIGPSADSAATDAWPYLAAPHGVAAPTGESP